MATENRPLSPHLQVYRWEWTMMMSITHRVTGVALAVGALLLACWLLALASGPQSFQAIHDFLGTWLGRLLLFGWTWSLLYHLANGVRHLIWDTGRALELPAAHAGAYAVMILSIVLTGAVWVGGYAAAGAFS